MSINLKKRIVMLVLALAMAMTVFTGYAFAATADTAAASSVTYYDITLSLPKGGTTVKGTAREKTISLNYAYYDLSTVVNNSGLSCYVNVRSSDGNVIVGDAAAVSGTGAYFVYYRSGYGSVGTKYVPSAQTDNDSAKTATLGGKWRP